MWSVVCSKKYMMEGDRAAKMKQNVKTLKEMERLFGEGGKVSTNSRFLVMSVWIDLLGWLD